VAERGTVRRVTRSQIVTVAHGRPARPSRAPSGLAAGLSLLPLLVLSLGPVPTATAASAEEVETLIRRGVELRKLHRDEEALALFQKADPVGHSPRTVGQLGLAEMAVGYWVDAEHHLVEALASDHPWISKNRAVLDRALADVRGNLGDIVVDGEPVGAGLFLDGRPIGSLPLPSGVRVPKGAVHVEARAAGFVSQTEEVRVVGGDRKTVTFRLARLAPRDPSTTRLLSPAGSTSQDPAGSSEKSSQSLDVRRTIGWTALAATVAGLAFAGVETAVWQKKRIDFNNRRGPPADNPTTSDKTMWVNACNSEVPDLGGQACRDLYDNSRHARTLAFVGYGVSVALGATAFVLLTSDGDTPSTKTALSCIATTAPGIRCSLTF
jgi:hypothetical protein